MLLPRRLNGACLLLATFLFPRLFEVGAFSTLRRLPTSRQQHWKRIRPRCRPLHVLRWPLHVLQPTEVPEALRNHDDNAHLSQFSSDLERLSIIRRPVPWADFSTPVAIISAGSSYTRIWTPATWRIHSVPPHRRYFKHMLRWYLSSTSRIISPAVLLSATYSLLAAYSLRHGRIGRYSLASLTLGKGASAAVGALTAPLALLLTLRTNAALARLNEARTVWGRLVLHTRNLAAMVRVNVLGSHPESAVLVARYLAVVGWALKSFVRDEGAEREEEVYRSMLGDEEVHWLMKQPRRPVAITLRLRQIIADVAARYPNYYVQHLSMDNEIGGIEAVVGVCERLAASPIPPTYSRHLSRIMVMYLLILPLGLVASGIPILGTAIASAFISYVLIGIDEIGVEIENPFPLLPLQELAGAVQSGVSGQILNDLPSCPSR